jgi:hypothetical protein
MPSRIHPPLADRRHLLLVGVLLALTASMVEAQLVVYDDFSSARLDQTRWVGRQLVTTGAGTGSLLEIQREVTNAQVLMLQTRVVSSKGLEPAPYSVENALMFHDSNALNEIMFDVVVRRVDVSGCTAGPAAEASARGVFPLFNDGLGDVVAIVGVTRSSASSAPPGELDVAASLVYRTDAGDTLLGYLALGSTTVGRSVRLRTRWEATRNRVRFQRDAEPLVSIEYTNPMIAGPGRPRKHLAAVGTVSDCSSGAASAAVVAAIDNVRVNP